MNDDGFSIGGFVAGALFTALGVLFMLRAFDLVDIRFDIVLSVAVIALGIALVAGALVRPRGGAPRG